MLNIVVVIPTYNPDQLLLSTLNDLNADPIIGPLEKIVVNDGSFPENKIISQVPSSGNLVVLHHDVNKGKGAAIKTAIRHVSKRNTNTHYILTVDSDGQHLAKDARAVVQGISRNLKAIHIGSRGLEKNKTPWRSYFGNVFSRTVFKCLYEGELKDTQSGLRAYPHHFFDTMLMLPSEHYDFEMEAIITALQDKVEIVETQIETVYLEQNRSSHFRPLIDSIRVLFVMGKAKFRRLKKNKT